MLLSFEPRNSLKTACTWCTEEEKTSNDKTREKGTSKNKHKIQLLPLLLLLSLLLQLLLSSFFILIIITLIIINIIISNNIKKTV